MSGDEGLWQALAGVFGDRYGLHVIGSYAVTLIVLAALAWWIVATNAQARRELDGLDRERQP